MDETTPLPGWLPATSVVVAKLLTAAFVVLAIVATAGVEQRSLPAFAAAILGTSGACLAGELAIIVCVARAARGLSTIGVVALMVMGVSFALGLASFIRWWMLAGDVVQRSGAQPLADAPSAVPVWLGFFIVGWLVALQDHTRPSGSVFPRVTGGVFVTVAVCGAVFLGASDVWIDIRLSQAGPLAALPSIGRVLFGFALMCAALTAFVTRLARQDLPAATARAEPR